MGTTCRGMHETGFQEWGFLIFRCIYGDDEAWDRYMRYFKEAIHESLAKDSCEFLEKYSRWTIVQDEADLQAASKLRVRQRFRDWRDQNPVWRGRGGSLEARPSRGRRSYLASPALHILPSRRP
ncbi:hypothetical protein PG991_010943 [Apiospora marii]|uniref:Uncharacterized protein n=1 Tax=Apiospora marii TaxID=335849 RepID=A0ABR1RCR8_9PEZI